MDRYERVVDASPAKVERAVREATDAGLARSSDATSRRLIVPIRAGIRAGVAELDWQVEGVGSATRLRLRVIEETLRVSTAALIVLGVGAAGGVLTVIWPLYPALLGLAPVGALLALVAWLLVVSRLRSYGPEDFLSAVADLASGEVGEPPPQSD